MGKILNRPGLTKVYRNGLYQVGFCVVISFIVLFNTFAISSYIVTTAEMSYRCLITECEDATNTPLYPPWLENAVPYTNGTPETCSRFVVQNLSETCSETTFTDTTQSCDTWVYDSDKETILSEWDLTCSSNQWKLSLVNTLNSLGLTIALMYAGYASDRYGRRTVLVISMLANAVFGLIQALSFNYWMYVIFVLLEKILSNGLYSSAYVLVVETLRPRTRILGACLLTSLAMAGETILTMIASYIVSWRTTLLIIYVPLFSALLLPYTMPESPRWLIACGSNEQADATIRKMLQKNGHDVTDEAIRELKVTSAGESTRNHENPMKQILRSRIMWTRLLFAAICWVAIKYFDEGLILNAANIAGYSTTNFGVIAVHIAGLLLGIIVIEFWGRKPATCGFCLVTGVLTLVFACIPSDSSADVLLVFFTIIKSCASVTLMALYLHTAEMFPTPLRQTLLGICIIEGWVGFMLASLTPSLADVLESLPMILYGIVAILTSFLTLTFPETRATQLPATMHDAEQIGKKLD